MAEGTQELEKNLKVADSYIQDSLNFISSIDDDLGELQVDIDKRVEVSRILDKIKEANKKIEEVEKEKPNLTTTVETPEGEVKELSVNILKVLSFYAEAYCRLADEQEKKGIKLCNQALSLLSNTSNNFEIKALVYHTLSEAYRLRGEKSKCIEMLEKAKEINTDESLGIELEKELDSAKNTSVIFFKTRAFNGSWKILLGLAGLTLLGFVGLVGAPGGAILMILFFGSLTWLYWWINI